MRQKKTGNKAGKIKLKRFKKRSIDLKSFASMFER